MQNSQMSQSQRLMSSSLVPKLLPIVAVALALCFNNVQAFLPHQNPPTAFRKNNHHVSSSTAILSSSSFVAPSFLPRGQQRMLLPLSSTFGRSTNEHIIHRRCSITQLFSTMKRIPAELEDVPIPFIDPSNDDSSSSSSSLKSIECYADCTCEINGIEYTVAVPCDYSVSLCYASDEDPDELIPIDITDTALMDDIFPIAESIVAEEYGEDLVLQRTPETLTLVGELELDDDDEEDDEDLDEIDNEDDDDEDEMDDDEEEVDVLLAFEHRDKEYQLVRIKDPILLVGKKNPQTANDATAMETRVLLTKEESDAIMPTLEEMYLNYQKELDENDEEFEDDEDEVVTPATTTENDTANENEYNEDDVEDDIVTFYDPQADKTNTLKTIDCFVDRVYVVDDVEYTIATPCDYVATICTTDEEDEEELNPIDIEPDTTKVIDELFPLFADAVKDEFDGEMTLVRTPQYLTLVGDIDLDEELSDEEEDDDEEYDDDEEEEEEVQVILSFTKDGKEYSLVRELEPMLLVGKKPEKESDDVTMDMRILLNAEESDEIVPILMEMYNDDDEDEEEE